MAADQLFIVSTLTDSDGIFVYRIADGDGHLELVRQYQEISKPFFIDLHPNGRVLYSTCDPGNIAAFSLDRSDGGLELINKQPSQGGLATSRSIRAVAWWWQPTTPAAV